MPSWEEIKAAGQDISHSAYRAAGSAFEMMYSGLGNGYQQMFQAGRLYPTIDRGVPGANTSSLNPEYTKMDHAYAQQETERETIEGITEDSYQPTNIDWQQYGRYIDHPRPDIPEPDMEPER